jgi:peptidoglycan/LPS O-acetylase OafA/YrhL
VVIVAAPCLAVKADRGDGNRISGLDSIRFLSALWVTIGHFGPIWPQDSHTGGFVRTANSVWTIGFCGPAAVIVFFVISGFCIHYPYRQGNLPVWKEYFIRRYVRIGLPLLAVLPLALFSGLDYLRMENSILWSLYAEIIYYTLYPFLISARTRWGWRAVLIAAFVFAMALALSNPTARNYASFGLYGNWILGLPCWLLGVQLAESASIQNSRSEHNLVWVRIGVWVASCAALVLNFHSPLGYPFTLNLFAILVYFWLLSEISSRA